MLRWPAFVLGSGWLSIIGSWVPYAAAQTDGAPAEPPLEPPPATPGEPAPPAAPPPAAAPPDSAPAAPPAAPPPTTTPPPSGEFPLPPPTEEKKPAARPAPPPPVVQDEPAAPVAEQKPPPSRATEGLFEEKHPSEVAHHEPENDEPDKVDNFKIGPVVGAGIPALLSIGGTVKVARFVGAGINFGLIPTVQLSYYGDATIAYKHLDFYGRIYPFGGGLFLHGGAGYATVQGTLKKSTPLNAIQPSLMGTATYESRGSVRTLMLTALLGYFHTFDVGFSIGVDAGAQIPIAPSKIDTSSSLDVSGITPEMEALLKDQIQKGFLDPGNEEVRTTLEKIGRSTIPTLNFRIGWIL